ncbi:helix-turn-helix domain-containing protein [Chryseobacterium sp. M5A1_1a]
MNKKLIPNYKLIYEDIIRKKYPHKKNQCQNILNKKKLSILDVVKLNDMIFDTKSKEAASFNQKLRSYSKASILEILNYQKVNNLNNIQTAIHFNLSKNSVSKWKKIFFSVNY